MKTFPMMKRGPQTELLDGFLNREFRVKIKIFLYFTSFNAVQVYSEPGSSGISAPQNPSKNKKNYF